MIFNGLTKISEKTSKIKLLDRIIPLKKTKNKVTIGRISHRAPGGEHE